MEEKEIKENVIDEKKQAALTAQAELIAGALKRSAASGGVWFNNSCRKSPVTYPNYKAVNPFASLVLGLDSEAKGYKTNVYMSYVTAQKHDLTVFDGEKGVPVNWTDWKKYSNKTDSKDVITAEQYNQLGDDDKAKYKGVPEKSIKYLFNADQTSISAVKPEDEKECQLRAGSNMDISSVVRAKREEHAKAFIDSARSNIVPVLETAGDAAYYDRARHIVFAPAAPETPALFARYMNDVTHQIVNAAVDRRGVSADAVKRRELIVEAATAVKLQDLGFPAKLSAKSLTNVDYWCRELRENPRLMAALEAGVNITVDKLNKAERGIKIERPLYLTDAVAKEAEKEALFDGRHNVSIILHGYVSEKGRMMVVVRDKDRGIADVILPAHAVSEKRVAHALEKEGYKAVSFFNNDIHTPYYAADDEFKGKEVSVETLVNWKLEKKQDIDVDDIIRRHPPVNIDKATVIKTDDNRWAMYIKPHGAEGFAVYPDKNDMSRYFVAVKCQEDVDSVRLTLARKYTNLAKTDPGIKVNIFGAGASKEDRDMVKSANFMRDKDGKCVCSANIKGVDNPVVRPVTAAQWNLLWIAGDKSTYKKDVAVRLFGDVIANARQEAAKNAVSQAAAQSDGIAPTSAHEGNHAESREEHEEEERAGAMRMNM